MSRRAQEKTDSLDMLLDTMCNTFGGIILIALLISMLARDVPSTTTVTDSSQKTDAVLQTYTNALVQHTQYQADLSRRAGTVELLAQNERLREQVDLARANSVNAQKTAAEWERKVEEARQNNSQLTAKLSNLNRHIQQVNDEIKPLTNNNAAELRIPKLRPIKGHTNWDIIVKGGKLFPIQILVNGQPRPNDKCFDIKSDGSVEFKTAFGIEAKDGSDGLVRILTSLNTNTYAINFHLFADSFPIFRRLRNTAIDKGFLYDVQMHQDDERLGMNQGPRREPSALN